MIRYKEVNNFVKTNLLDFPKNFTKEKTNPNSLYTCSWNLNNEWKLNIELVYNFSVTPLEGFRNLI